MIGLLLIPVAAVLGAWAHELIHAALVTWLGGTVVRIDLWQLHIEFQGLTEPGTQMVRWAPFVIGAILGASFTIAGGAWTPAALLGWGVFTLLGGEREPGIPWALQRVRRAM